MAIIYDDTDKGWAGRNPVPYDRLDATKHYLTHYENWKFLNFILQASDDRVERHQANKEIGICDRKLTYWSRHPNWSRDKAEEGKRKIDQNWSQKGGTNAG